MESKNNGDHVQKLLEAVILSTGPKQKKPERLAFVFFIFLWNKLFALGVALFHAFAVRRLRCQACQEWLLSGRLDEFFGFFANTECADFDAG